MAEMNNAFKVKKGLDVVGDSALHGNAMVDGYITTPTLASTENSTKVATTAFVRTAIANLVANSPSTLDTLNELATALGDDPNFATTMTNQLALKAPLASPALTGSPTAPTPATADNSTLIATTAYIKNQLYATLASPALTGTPTAPTANFGDNTILIANTAFVQAAMSATGFGYDAAAIPGGSTVSIDTATIPTGLYVVTTNNTGTKPTGYTTGFLLVSRGTGSTKVHQIYFDDSTARTFSRAYASAAWTSWRETAYTDSPALTGTPTAPTAAIDTSTTQIATTGFVTGQASNTNPTMAGTATPGTSTRFSRQDHVHPTDTTRAPLVSPGFSGVPTAPTASPNTNTIQIATTAYADAIAALKANISNPAFTGNVTVSGGLSSDDFADIPFVDNGNYLSTAASLTGAFKIKLPVAYTTTQITFEVNIHEAVTDSAFKMRISGLNRGSDSSWQFVTAHTNGGVASRIPNVRFGNDGSTCCVWIGELTDVWTTPQIQVTNIVLGNAGLSSSWLSGWAVSLVTTFDTVKTGPITPNKTAFLNSPALTGTPTAPTAAASDNSSQIANTSWVNAAIAASGSTSIVSIPVTSTAMTLTAAQYANSMIIFTGALTGNTTITVPNTAHAFIAANNTTGSYTLTIKSNGQTPSVQIVQNKANSLYCDTTGVYATSSTTGVQFAKQTSLALDTTLDLSYLGSIVFVTASGKTITLPLANTFPAGAGVAIFNNSTGNINVATSGSDTFDAIASPLMLYPNDCYFLESTNGTNWHTVWYSNEKSPKFKTSISAPIALLGGATDNGTDKLQVSGSTTLSGAVNTTGDFTITNATNSVVGSFSSASYTGGLQIEAYNVGNTVKKNIAIAVASASRVLIGTTTDNGADKLQVNGTIKSLTGGFVFPDGTTQTTANGVTAPTSTVFTPTAGATQITTTGYNAPLVEVFKNNGRLIPNVDFTLPDGVNISLTTAATGRDRYEVLTKVIYSPSTVFQPTSQTFSVAVGSSTITVNYNVNCFWVFKNKSKLIPTTDYTGTNGTSITLTSASTSTSDTYEVVTFTPFTVNGMLPLTGGTLTGAITLPDGFSMSNTPMGRNAIMNGNFDLWQRGTSYTANTTGAQYLADRWLVDCSGSSKAVSQQSFTLGQGVVPYEPVYFHRTVVTSSTGTSNYVLQAQRIEGVRTFAGQTATLSFWAKADASRNIAVEFSQIFGSGGSPSSAVTGIGVTTCALTSSWQKFTISVAIPSISGKTIGTSGGDYLQSRFWFDAGSGYNSITNSLGQQSGTFDIAQVQFESGSHSTPFERRSLAHETLLCQRYYETLSGVVYNGYGNSGNVLGYTFCLKVTKRTPPTIGATFNVSNCTVVIASSGPDFFQINSTLSTTGIFSFANSGVISANSEL